MKSNRKDSVLSIGSPLALPEYIHDVPELSSCDIIGDVHGCYRECAELLRKLGHADLLEPERLSPSERAPALLFVGDLVDRGEESMEVLRLVMDLREKGYAQVVMGNHDYRFYRWLLGQDVKIQHGLEQTIEQFYRIPSGEREEMRERLLRFFSSVPYAIRFDQGRAVVVHAAWRPRMKEETELKRLRYYAMYGPVTGELTPEGYPERIDWASTYKGPEFAVFGHQVYLQPYQQEFAWGIDTGCVYGNALTALRYPSRELVSIKSHFARAVYHRPMGPGAEE